jgi:hypothetical protein
MPFVFPRKVADFIELLPKKAIWTSSRIEETAKEPKKNVKELEKKPVI